MIGKILKYCLRISAKCKMQNAKCKMQNAKCKSTLLFGKSKEKFKEFDVGI